MTSLHGSLTPVENADECGSFGYLFPDAPTVPFDADTSTLLTPLHSEMYRHLDPEDLNNSALAPVMTYLGQFIDHDITRQGLSRADAGEVVDIFGPNGEGFAPQPRETVADAIKNERTGRLDLDSLYGPREPTGDAATDKLMGLMRNPNDRAKMLIGLPSPTEGGIPSGLPVDGEADLPRLRRLMRPEAGDPLFTQADFDALPDDMKRRFSTKTGEPNMHAAVIGDPRNDENLFVAQLHMVFLRFHNAMVDTLRAEGFEGDADALFDAARAEVVLHYQWLVMNVYLPQVCDPVALQAVKASGAAMYGAFKDACGHEAGDHFPMPIEFAAGAFRFGHSMVRGNYDWNSAFGHEGSILPTANFALMFQFTGNGDNPMNGFKTLPQNWVSDWSRTGLANSEFAQRTTRRIDTNVALPLQDMANEGDKVDEKNLAARNLKRGIRMSLPTAQACVDALNATHGFALRPLTKAELTSGRTGNELKDLRYDEATPLWFYVLKEAEVRQAGQRLGALGTHLVAGTIAGLIIHDPNSYWNRDGSIEGRWHPVDGLRPAGRLVDSLPDFLRAAGVLEG